MMRKFYPGLVGCFCLLVWLPLTSSAGIWHDLDSELSARQVASEPLYYRALQADVASLQTRLAQAPDERDSILKQGEELELPMPYGLMQRFLVQASPVMAPSLAERYPEIRTYRVTGIDEPASSGRLDLTPSGFHAMLTTPSGTVFINPDDSGDYRSFYKRDYAKARQQAAPHVCLQARQKEP
ncbi:MAG: hypothetical protein P8179_02775 [Candidatus Thiodiazotropha sp.]